MKLKNFFAKFFKKNFFNSDWRCLACGKEVFNGNKFCSSCASTLPINNGAICAHCGRKVAVATEYCSTCKENILSLEKCRSVYYYASPISTLIKKLKYDNGRYLADVFAESLAHLYFKNYFNADYLVYVPMTEKSKRKRGYKHAELLAEKVSEKTGVPVLHCIAKVRETKRQARLTRSERLKNLSEAFSILDKKTVKDKVFVLIDDVTTTGATAETVASKLKKAGADKVYLITVASTLPINKY